MESRLSSLWHSAATGLCFLGFWLLAATATLFILPFALIPPGQRARRVRRLAGVGFRLLLGWIEALGIGRFRVEGREWTDAARGRLLVANHPCFLDVVALLAYLPDANCVMKGNLRRHPFFALFVRAGGYLGNDSDPERVIEACRKAHERGEAIVIFPEGSRSAPGAAPHFRRGAAQIAVRTGMEILPVTIRCTPPVLTHGRPWFRMPPERFAHVLCLHKPRSPEAFAPLDGLLPSLAARRLTQGLEDYFIRTLNAAEPMKIYTAAESSPQ
ncbi:MAG: lysophospholipid acyltransferase family protein [Gammaproteobacteria bacterium]